MYNSITATITVYHLDLSKTRKSTLVQQHCKDKPTICVGDEG